MIENIYYYVLYNKANKTFMQTNCEFNAIEPNRVYLFTNEQYARICAESFGDKNIVVMTVKLNVVGVYEFATGDK